MNIIFSFFQRYIKKIKRSQLRQMIRGYRVLKQAGQTNLIFLVNKALTERHLNIKNKYFFRFMMGQGYDLSEIIVKQYLFTRIGGEALNSVLLRSKGKKNGKIVYPMPKKWREIVSEHGFSVDNFRSALLWQVYIFSLFLYGSWKLFQILFSSIFSLHFKSHQKNEHIYFANLNAKNLVLNQDRIVNYNILSWYLLWPDRAAKLKEVRHSVKNVPDRNIRDVKIKYQKNILPNAIKVIPLAKYLIWSLGAILISFIDFLRGHWWHPLLLNQIALAKKVRALPLNSLASEYWFHNSGWFYRPLWTYEAESLGSIITFYFYSTNIEPFKRKSEILPNAAYNYKIMTWPHYLVWDSYQANYIKKLVSPKKIQIVGPIWFDGKVSAFDIPKGKKIIAIFDVQPVRNSIYVTLGLDYDYYIYQTSYKFLLDIYQSFNNDAYIFVLKRKRRIGSRLHPLYKKLISNLEENSNFISIDEDISASLIIKKSDIVISMPFTSTALIAKDLGKPTIYYDSTGELIKNDPAAHGIDIISMPQDLSSWIKMQTHDN